jgi:hypothetical protein
MGGASMAVIDDENVFFYNPALLGLMKNKQLTIFDLSISSNSAVFDYYDFLKDNEDDIKDIHKLSTEEQKDLFDKTNEIGSSLDAATAFVDGPLNIQYKSKNFGVGLFTSANLFGNIYPNAANLPVMDAFIQSDFVTIMSLCQQVENLFPRKLYLGVSGKFLYRLVSSKIEPIPILYDKTLDLYKGTNFGIDISAFYQFSNQVALGLAIYDIFASDIKWSSDSENPRTIKPDGNIDPTMRFGISATPIVNVHKFLQHVTVALDFEQPFDDDVTFFKKLFFGAEAQLIPALKFRTGFYQGYPVVGMGFQSRIFKFDYAYFSEEMGNYAGQISNYQHVVRFQFGFGFGS